MWLSESKWSNRQRMGLAKLLNLIFIPFNLLILVKNKETVVLIKYIKYSVTVLVENDFKLWFTK
jgi:hypothetical protein